MLDLILAACGVVLLLAAFAALHHTRRAELSARSLAALLVGAAGGSCIVRAALGEPVAVQELLLPLGVAVWVVGQAWRGRADPPEAPGAVILYPWAGSKEQRQ